MGDLNGLGTLVCAEPQLRSRGTPRPQEAIADWGVGWLPVGDFLPAEGSAVRHIFDQGSCGAACVADGGGRFAPANCPCSIIAPFMGPCGANS
jgi:hypothetical protein